MQRKGGRVVYTMTAAITRAEDNATKNHSHAGQDWKIPYLSNDLVLTIFVYLIKRVSKLPALNHPFVLFVSTVRAVSLRNSHQQGNTGAKSSSSHEGRQASSAAQEKL